MNHLSHLFEPGFHETPIAALFDGRTAFGGDAPVFAEPLYVLAFTNRSGSNLLGEYLNSFARLRGFGEVLNHGVVATHSARLGLRTFPDYLRFLVEQRSRTVALGVKASWDQLAMLLRWRIDRMFPETRVIHVQRLDAIGQAISYHIALQTNQWTSQQEAHPEVLPVYDFERICNIVHNFERANTAIVLAAEARGLPYARVTYEEVTTDPGAVIERLQAWAGLSRRSTALPQPRLQKQASGESYAFRARFLRDYRTAAGL